MAKFTLATGTVAQTDFVGFILNPDEVKTQTTGLQMLVRKLTNAPADISAAWRIRFDGTSGFDLVKPDGTSTKLPASLTDVLAEILAGRKDFRLAPRTDGGSVGSAGALALSEGECPELAAAPLGFWNARIPKAPKRATAAVPAARAKSRWSL